MSSHSSHNDQIFDLWSEYCAASHLLSSSPALSQFLFDVMVSKASSDFEEFLDNVIKDQPFGREGCFTFSSPSYIIENPYEFGSFDGRIQLDTDANISPSGTDETAFIWLDDFIGAVKLATEFYADSVLKLNELGKICLDLDMLVMKYSHHLDSKPNGT
jgi:hypothetical protein